jgi:hypothetical protein
VEVAAAGEEEVVWDGLLLVLDAGVVWVDG